MSLREDEKISVEIASIATGEIPKSYVAFGNLIWEVFRLGQKYNQIQEREAKEELVNILKHFVEKYSLFKCNACNASCDFYFKHCKFKQAKELIDNHIEKDKEVI